MHGITGGVDHDGAEVIELLPEQAARPYGIVYLATNTANGKGYVGQTVKVLKVRMGEHQQDAHMRRGKGYFHSAIRKHGFESFTWQVLMTCGSRDDLNATEQAYISTMKTKVPNGYNLTDGGEGTSGYAVSTETKQKIGRGNKGKVRSAQARQKNSEARMGNTNHKGKTHSAETKQKIREASMGNTNCKGKILSAEHRQKLREASMGNTNCKGRVHTAETKQKLREASMGNANRKGAVHSAESRQKMSEASMGNTHNKGRVHSAETRQKIREANIGRICSAESRQKMSEAQRGRVCSAETRQKISRGNTGKHVVSAETRQKMSESQKRYRKSIGCL